MHLLHVFEPFLKLRLVKNPNTPGLSTNQVTLSFLPLSAAQKMAGRENLKQRKGKRTPSSPTGANEDDLPLPPNWERGMKDGKPYYVDHTTKTTTVRHALSSSARFKFVSLML